MSDCYYDLHIHSALSPCGENDMTPSSIAGMLALSGIGVAALTDHNSAENCPAFCEACTAYGVVPIAGMELTVAEEIHVVCLFPTLEGALGFSAEVAEHRMKIRNREEIFGEQLIMNSDDEVIGKDPYYLPAATDISLLEAPAMVEKHGGICYPAHIDRTSGGLLAILGDFPPELAFSCYEIYDFGLKAEYEEKYPVLKDKVCISCSDAHTLEKLLEKNRSLPIGDGDAETVIRRLFGLLKKEVTE